MQLIGWKKIVRSVPLTRCSHSPLPFEKNKFLFCRKKKKKLTTQRDYENDATMKTIHAEKKR